MLSTAPPPDVGGGWCPAVAVSLTAERERDDDSMRDCLRCLIRRFGPVL